MTTATATQSWINKGANDLPDWLRPHMQGKREPNGTFLIITRALSKWQKDDKPLSARVLVSNIVLLRDDIAYTCPAAEAKELLAGLDAAEAPVPPVSSSNGSGTNLAPSAADIRQRNPATRIKTRAAPQSKTQRRVGVAAPQRQQAYAPAKGSRPTIEWLHVDRLSLDISYQRSTDNDASRRLIASIAAKFDWRLCTPLVVSRRPDGSFAVIDGQHRLLAARLRKMDDLPCCVFTYDSPQDEARMFVAANRSRKPMNRLDDFHAAIAAGDDEALQVRQLITDAGLTVARNTSSSAWAAGEIAFTGSVASVLRKHGAATTSQALTMIAEAFPDQKVTQAGSIFLGIVKVLTDAKLGQDQDRLFRALLKYDADEWGSFVTGLKGGDTRATAIRDALMMAYDETPTEDNQ